MPVTPEQIRRRAVLGVAAACGVVLWQHLVGGGAQAHLSTVAGHTQGLLLDLMLTVPATVAACWLADLLLARVAGGRGDRDGRERPVPGAVVAAAVSLCGLPLLAGLGPVQLAAHRLFLDLGAGAHHHTTGGPAAGGWWVVRDALLTQPVVFAVVLAVLGLSGRRAAGGPGEWLRRWRRRGVRALAAGLPLGLAATLSPLTAPGAAGAAGSAEQASSSSTVPTRGEPVSAEVAAEAGGCDTAPTRNYDVAAINVDLTVDRFGDHDPFGYMYVLIDDEGAVRAQEAALKAAARDPAGATGAKVSTGLAEDPIQPLVLRARLGECVVVNLTNKLTAPPRGGPGFSTTPVITQAGGVPSVSIDMQGVSYAATDNGAATGSYPSAVMVPPGGTHTYRYYLDPMLGEGARTFRSGGASTQLTAHGLFGALVAEPAGSRWFDTRLGQERTTDVGWNSWEAMVSAPGEPTFREFTLMYHEIGDENFNLRRPQREGDPSGLTPDPDGNGAPVPMVDENGQARAGGLTKSYRPGSRAINYRSEPFWRRLSSLAGIGKTDAQIEEYESLAYASYAFGDPATPMPRSYLGEPTKTRLVHPGFEQLHVHHLHGGGDRWRQNPEADDTDMDGGLSKVPVQNAKSIRLDSQTVGPEESYNLEHECGAGGCQQAAGDFLFHCHIAHHYVAGMWSFWRVFDTRQAGLATLPGRTAAPTAVNSAALIGRQFEGRTVVAAANLTNPNTQVSVNDLVERQIPPRGARLDDTDATVWDWSVQGPADAPVYLGEPEDTRAWADYTSPTPGARPQIMFNPTNGRPAWPLLRPHLAARPPFSPAGHTGAPWLGETASAQRPDGLCPAAAPVKPFGVTAVSLPLQMTTRERDQNGQLYVLTEDKQAVIDKANQGVPPDPLTIRSNVGDCVAITFSNEMDAGVQSKVNMHTHFVQFDPQASDGVISGFSYEQSIYSTAHEGRTASAATAAGAGTVQVNSVDRLRVGIFIGVGVGRTNTEIRKITAINGNTLTFDRALSQAHAAGEPVTVEFTQYRWFSDVDSGTVFWHDHVAGLTSWAHGLFGAHIIEPAGSTYHDPSTGAQVRSGTIVDIHTSGTVGTGVRSSFREFMIFLHNGRRGRPELTNSAFFGVLGQNRNFGQECEEGSINLRAEPIGERVPPGATPADPATTDQRQEFNGSVCRTTTSNQAVAGGTNTVNATVTAVDPYVFSSVKYGDPRTPLLRAYVGDPVVIRTIGLAERAEGLRIQGHRFRQERFNADGGLIDTATTGISERFDYLLDGGAGGPAGMSGDYLYYSSRNFALETGAWGIFRVHDRRQSDLAVLPGRTAPPTGTGYPLLGAASGNTQQSPGSNPPPASQAGVASNTTDACPSSAPARPYDVSIFDSTLATRPFADTNGVVYALTSDVAAIRSGAKKLEPLVLRANAGECVQITLRNQISTASRYGGARAGFDLSKLLVNPQLSGGAAIGRNPDSTVARGQSITYRAYADRELGTSLFRDMGSVAAQRHGAYGLLIVEPAGSTWADSATNAALTSTRTSTQAIIRPASGARFREFALTMQTTDQHYGRSVVPYQDVVAGSGVNSTFTAGNPAVADKAFTNINYTSEPITTRLGLTASPPSANPDYGAAYSSAGHGDPATPLLRAYAGDPVVIRLGIGATDQYHSFTVAGHMFPREPGMFDGTSDLRSSLLVARSLTAGETQETELVGGAGGPSAMPGDYRYGDARQPFADAGLWGLLRVVPAGPTLGDLARL